MHERTVHALMPVPTNWRFMCEARTVVKGAAEGPAGLDPRLKRRQQAEHPEQVLHGAQRRAASRGGQHAGVAEGLPPVYDDPFPTAAVAARARKEVEGERCGGQKPYPDEERDRLRDVALKCC